MARRLSLGAVRVQGGSMHPTLRDGDTCLVLWGARIRAGDVVVARLPDRPLGIKRAAFCEPSPDGPRWWLRADNVGGGTDSAAFGTVSATDLLGRVLLRYWPRPAPLRRRS